MTRWTYRHINLEPGEDYFEALRLNGEIGWEAWHMEVNERGWRTIYFKMQERKQERRPA